MAPHETIGDGSESRTSPLLASASGELQPFEESYWTTRGSSTVVSGYGQPILDAESTGSAGSLVSQGVTLSRQTSEGAASRCSESSAKGMPSASVWGCAISLASTCIGSGLLALPFAFASAGGVATGLTLLLVAAALSSFVSQLLCACCDWTGKVSYEELAIAAFGSVGSTFMEVLVIWLLMGAMTSLLVIAGDSLILVFGHLSPLGVGRWSRALLTSLDVALVIFPLSRLQSPASLVYSNAIAVACTLLVGFLLIASTTTTGWAWTSEAPLLFESKGYAGVLQAVPIIMLSLGCQVQVPCVYADLESRSAERMSGAILAAMASCVVIYLMVATSGTWAAAQHGISRASSLPGNILDVFAPDDRLGLAMRAVVSVAVTLVYPMLCLPCCSTLDHILFGGGAVRRSRWRHSMQTLIVVVLTVVLSTVENNLARVFGFTGATAGALICYVLPQVIYLRLRQKQSKETQAATQWTAGLCRVALACMVPLVLLTSWQAV